MFAILLITWMFIGLLFAFYQILIIKMQIKDLNQEIHTLKEDLNIFDMKGNPYEL